ncbi:MAG: 1-(5-phosphoribosyl)-5-[(5-phosphoribosylamino)methylideneamino]imidazole-4-carboxamide isomerase [Deltaproteobacteria bacterium]|nr:1-(5-phosphoribosyl)-5-[(5-phosphoribosylamino)methylideneamino]imidazole-4-carboxamide isomerase [Deltaproteobacteria bacterium]
MKIIPAVDIKNGRCVRLLQGRLDTETVYSNDPATMARRWELAGAKLIHVVDLDGAVNKQPHNTEAIRRILATVSAEVQVGGGIRNRETIDMYLKLGVRRVVIGTEAIRNPKLVREAAKTYPGRIVVGIDARDGYVAIDGWTHTSPVDVIELAKRFEDAGVAAVNFTDIHRDGMQTGPNIEQTRRLAEAIDIPVVASGGVSKMEDIKNLMSLKAIGVEGIIIGRALYTGKLDLSAVIKFVRQHDVTNDV